MEKENFILTNTVLKPVPHMQNIMLYQADEVHSLWHMSEQQLQKKNMQPPFWAFAWAGGVGLSRFILDNPEYIKSKTVCDFASGSGMVGIAACHAKAKTVTSIDIDPFAFHAMQLNAKANGVMMNFSQENIIGTIPDAEVILAGDIFYDRAFAAATIPWFQALIKAGKTVLIGDPGRTYAPEGLHMLKQYEVSVLPLIEEGTDKTVTVWRF